VAEVAARAVGPAAQEEQARDHLLGVVVRDAHYAMAVPLRFAFQDLRPQGQADRVAVILKFDGVPHWAYLLDPEFAIRSCVCLLAYEAGLVRPARQRLHPNDTDFSDQSR